MPKKGDIVVRTGNSNSSDFLKEHFIGRIYEVIKEDNVYASYEDDLSMSSNNFRYANQEEIDAFKIEGISDISKISYQKESKMVVGDIMVRIKKTRIDKKHRIGRMYEILKINENNHYYYRTDTYLHSFNIRKATTEEAIRYANGNKFIDEEFKIGDIVVITKGHTDWTEEMNNYIGKIVRLNIKLDPSNNAFTVTNCPNIWNYNHGHFRRATKYEIEYYKSNEDTYKGFTVGDEVEIINAEFRFSNTTKITKGNILTIKNFNNPKNNSYIWNIEFTNNTTGASDNCISNYIKLINTKNQENEENQFIKKNRRESKGTAIKIPSTTRSVAVGSRPIGNKQTAKFKRTRIASIEICFTAVTD